jgi:hypothetical protein
MEEYITNLEMCDQFGCILGCIHDYASHPSKPDSVLFLRTGDVDHEDNENLIEDCDFVRFLFCPDCGECNHWEVIDGVS